jgi:hypothetical protein
MVNRRGSKKVRSKAEARANLKAEQIEKDFPKGVRKAMKEVQT